MAKIVFAGKNRFLPENIFIKTKLCYTGLVLCTFAELAVAVSVSIQH